MSNKVCPNTSCFQMLFVAQLVLPFKGLWMRTDQALSFSTALS